MRAAGLGWGRGADPGWGVRLRGPPHPPCVLLALQERGVLVSQQGRDSGRPRLACSRVVHWPVPKTQTGLAVFGQQQSRLHLSREGARLCEGDLTGCGTKTVLSGNNIEGTVCLAQLGPRDPGEQTQSVRAARAQGHMWGWDAQERARWLG